jgi:hypothetical protein
MLTQTIPALIDALKQALPPEAIGPLAQALGNCAQPLAHRGGVNFAAPRKRNANGTYQGSVYGGNSLSGGNAWNPALYQNLFPGGDTYNSGDYHNQVDIGGMNLTWNEGNRYDSQFYFPTNQVFQQNQYFGGPTVNITGGQQVDYINNQYFDGDTINVSNVTTEVINGDPVAGPAGAPGADGKDGQRGAPGAPGVGFGALPPGFFGPIRYLTGNPKIRYTPERVSRAHRYMKDAWVRGASTFTVPSYAISGGTVCIQPNPAVLYIPTDAISGGSVAFSPNATWYSVPTGFTFDPDTCSITPSGYASFYAFASSPTGEVYGTAATASAVTVASTASACGTISGTLAPYVSFIAATTAASTRASVVAASGFVVKGQDADFWERAPASVVVSREPLLANINPANARVYQQ